MIFETSHSKLDEREYPDEEDFQDHDDDLAETLPCPECGREIYEDSPTCPHCGCYVTFTNSLWSGRSLLWIVLGALGIVAVVLSLALDAI